MALRLADHFFNERDLIGRVMRTVKPVKHKHAGTPRWGWVSKTFTVGSCMFSPPPWMTRGDDGDRYTHSDESCGFWL